MKILFHDRETKKNGSRSNRKKGCLKAEDVFQLFDRGAFRLSLRGGGTIVEMTEGNGKFQRGRLGSHLHTLLGNNVARS